MTINANPSIPFTASAYAQNQAELTRLTKLRREVVERLKTAREMGDLSENGAYTYAKFELGTIGRRLRYLKHILANGYVAKVSSQANVANFGRMVTLKNATRELTFLLVSEHEANPTQHKFSLQSPIGQATQGKRAGEEIEVTTPAGKVKYTVINVK